MSVNVQIRGRRAQLRVTDRLLPKPFFATFDAADEARAYGQQLHELLERGIVPVELAGQAPRVADPLLIELVRTYTQQAPITDSDSRLLDTLLDEIAGVRRRQVTATWVDTYVRDLKLKRHLAPSSIRKRIGVLARVVDWHDRRTASPGAPAPVNALRTLPRGYSAYSKPEAAALLARKLEPKRDVARDRRLAQAEESAVRAALAGVKRADRERALAVDQAFTLLFDLLLQAGLRLREAIRLRVDQVDLQRRVLLVEGSKGHRGAIKPRTVPLVPSLATSLAPWCDGKAGLVFPFWDGTAGDVQKATARISARFAVLFDYAKVADFTAHDLRHEATCRWVEMRSAGGGWLFSDVEICRIMGWSDPRMMLRYASLRGEDLAARLQAQVPA